MPQLGTAERPVNARSCKWHKTRLGSMTIPVGTMSRRMFGAKVDLKTLDHIYVYSPRTGKTMVFFNRGATYRVTGPDRAVIDGYRFGVEGNGIIIEVSV